MACRRTAANLMTKLIGTVTGAVMFCNMLTASWTFAVTDEPPAAIHSDGSAQHSQTGISKQQPNGPHFVALPNGTFMVPYIQTIPGTDVQFKMMPIPGGKFQMGSRADDPYYQPDEGPQCEIEIEPFWMGQYEVSWDEYHVFCDLDHLFPRVQETGKFIRTEQNEVDGVTAPTTLYEPTIVYSFGDQSFSPAGMITQFSAKQYTKFLSLLTGTFYRLPTEAEWEYACRAGTKSTWYFGDDPNVLKEHAWYKDNSEVKDDYSRHISGQKKPNSWGLYDMYGNVAEWTLDVYHKDAYLLRNTTRGSIDSSIPKDLSLEPTPAMVLRGGGFMSPIERCRSAVRQASQDIEWKDEDPDVPNSPWWYTSTEANEAGFRLLRTLDEPKVRAIREQAWAAAHPNIAQDVNDRIRTGRGNVGIVTPELAAEIQNLRKPKKQK